MVVTLAQKKAKDKWRKKNQKKVTISSYKASAGTFIRRHASIKELLELRILIDGQIEVLRSKPDKEPFGEYIRKNGEIQTSIIDDETFKDE